MYLIQYIKNIIISPYPEYTIINVVFLYSFFI